MPDRHELELRLADVADVVDAVPTNDDGELLPGIDLGGFLSALGHALTGSSGCVEPEEWNTKREAALDTHREGLGLDRPLADGATEGRNLGPSLGVEGLRPGGITRFSPDYRTVLLDSVGAVALKLSPTGELAVYLEVGGKVNKQPHRDEGALLMPPAMAAELCAELIVAANAAQHAGAEGRLLSLGLNEALDRKRAERGIA